MEKSHIFLSISACNGVCIAMEKSLWERFQDFIPVFSSETMFFFVISFLVSK